MKARSGTASQTRTEAGVAIQRSAKAMTAKKAVRTRCSRVRARRSPTATPTSANTVWAVINHNSEFAVIPEPNTIGLLLLMGSAAFLRRLRLR